MALDLRLETLLCCSIQKSIQLKGTGIQEQGKLKLSRESPRFVAVLIHNFPFLTVVPEEFEGGLATLYVSPVFKNQNIWQDSGQVCTYWVVVVERMLQHQ